MVTVGLFDNLEFTLTDTPGVRLTCDDPALPTDASNLVVKTATGLLDAASLGGGSSDGAFTLLALNQLLQLNWSPDRLATLASRYGSDLAFFCHGPSSICTGRVIRFAMYRPIQLAPTRIVSVTMRKNDR